MRRQSTFSSIVVCRLIMYSLMGWIPAASIATNAGGYSHYLTALPIIVIPIIRLAAKLWKPSSKCSIYPITTQL